MLVAAASVVAVQAGAAGKRNATRKGSNVRRDEWTPDNKLFCCIAIIGLLMAVLSVLKDMW
jgi:hypothetical protein